MDDLIKNLRTHANRARSSYTRMLSFEAADRIESLEAENKLSIVAMTHAAEKVESLTARVAYLEGNMGFNDFIAAAERWLENYPPDIFDGSSGDPGPVFVVELRAAIAKLPPLPPETSE